MERKPLQQEVWLADLNPIMGSEQAGIRPVLVVSRNEFNAASRLVTVAPLTSSMTMQRHPGAVFIPAGVSGARLDSLVIAFQVRTIDQLRLRHMLYRLPDLYMEQVKQVLTQHFDLR